MTRLLNVLLIAVIFLALAVASGRAYDQTLVGRGPSAASSLDTSAVAPGPNLASRPTSTVRQTICRVFGRECAKAIRVAICESHLNVYAVGGGGRYLGLFQQGAYSRARYGFGWSAWEQARGAKRHRDAEGWAPWPVCGRR